MELIPLTRALALDCEMVGTGPAGKYSRLARTSVVNENGDCVYDTYVKVYETVTNYRTKVSGIRPENLKNGADFYQVRNAIKEMIKGRILVGHSVHHDLWILNLSHPENHTRDTSTYEPFLEMHRQPSLRFLAQRILDRDIQGSEHSSIEDAKACMDIYKKYKHEWEKVYLPSYAKTNGGISDYIESERLNCYFYHLAIISSEMKVIYEYDINKNESQKGANKKVSRAQRGTKQNREIGTHSGTRQSKKGSAQNSEHSSAKTSYAKTNEGISGYIDVERISYYYYHLTNLSKDIKNFDDINKNVDEVKKGTNKKVSRAMRGTKQNVTSGTHSGTRKNKKGSAQNGTRHNQKGSVQNGTRQNHTGCAQKGTRQNNKNSAQNCTRQNNEDSAKNGTRHNQKGSVQNGTRQNHTGCAQKGTRQNNKNSAQNCTRQNNEGSAQNGTRHNQKGSVQNGTRQNHTGCAQKGTRQNNKNSAQNCTRQNNEGSDTRQNYKREDQISTSQYDKSAKLLKGLQVKKNNSKEYV